MLPKDVTITAPACSLGEAAALIQAGAGELYCALMTDGWVDRFGTGDLLTRRQGRGSHVRTWRELSDIREYAAAQGCTVSLVVNGRYTRRQLPEVASLVGRWERTGGTSVIVNDWGLLLSLQESGSRLRRSLSTLAGVYNAASARFFQKLGVTRIVLPRSIPLGQAAAIVRGCPGIEYESLVFFQNCEFIDGMCGFFHAQVWSEQFDADCDHEVDPATGERVVRVLDPEYEGHGCALRWETSRGAVVHRDTDGVAPACGACDLPALRELGVRHWKLAGRGYDTGTLTRAVRFLVDSWDLPDRTAVRRMYQDRFGCACGPQTCYFTADDRVEHSHGS